MKKLFFSGTFLFLAGIALLGQTSSTAHKADSLRRIWLTPPQVGMADSTRLQAVAELQWLYFETAPDSLLRLSNTICKDARNRGDKRWLAQGLYGQAIYQRRSGSADSARYFCHQALPYLEKNKTPEIYSNILSFIGTEWSQTANWDSAIYYLNLALEIQETWHLPAEEVHHNLATVYQNQGQFVKALEYFKASRTGRNPHIQINSATNAGNLLLNFGLREEARENMLSAVRIADSLGNIPSRIIAYAGMVSAAQNLQEVDYWLNKGDALWTENDFVDIKIFLWYYAAAQYVDSLKYIKAKPLLVKCAKLGTQRSLAQMSAFCNLSLARIACAEKRPLEALALCREVKPYFLQENAAINLEILFKVFSAAFDLLGNRDSAYFYLKLKDQYATQNAEQNNKVSALLEYVKYKTKLEQEALQKAKESAEALAQETKARHQLTYWFSGLAILLLSSMALFWFSLYRRTKRAEQALAETNRKLTGEQEKLKRSNEKLKQFSGIVSHDILSNLDLNLSAGNILVGVQPKQESLIKYYQMTQDTNRQLKNYCLNLLETARTNNAQDLNDPMPIVETVLQRLDGNLKQAGFRVNLGQLSPSVLPLAVIEQLFQNLITNTLRHAAAVPNPELAIRETSEPGGKQQWIVEDNGPGVPEAQREHIFEARKEKDSGRAGHQIGLHLLRKTLWDHEATIHVEQVESGGAKWVISLPS